MSPRPAALMRMLVDRLAQLKFTAVKLGDSLDIRNVNVSSSTGEFVMKDLAKAVDKSEVNKLAVEAWMTKAEGVLHCAFHVRFFSNTSTIQALDQLSSSLSTLNISFPSPMLFGIKELTLDSYMRASR